MTQHWQSLTNEELIRLTRDTPAELVRLLASRLEECLNDDEAIEETNTELRGVVERADTDLEWIEAQLNFKATDPIQEAWPRVQAVQKWLADREPYADDV